MNRVLSRVLVPALVGFGVLACQSLPTRPVNMAPRPGSQLGSERGRAAPLAAGLTLEPAPAARAAPSATSPIELGPPHAAGATNAAIGHGGPLLLRRAAADASWVVLCQARGDSDGNGRLELTLGPRGELRGDTPGSFFWQGASEQVEGVLLAAGANDRFLAFGKGQLVAIVDSVGDRGFALTDVDARYSAETLDWVRSLAFDPSGTRLVYVRRTQAPARVVIKNLLDGSELAFDPGAGEIWRVRFDASGAYVLVDLLNDTNRSGKIELPAPALSEPPPCLPAGSSYRAWVGRGDRPARVWLDSATGRLESAQTILLALKKALIVRDASGALSAVQGQKSVPLEPAECKGRIVQADLERSLLVVACAQKKKTGRVSLELVDLAGHRQPLNAELAAVEADREASSGARLVPLYPGSDVALLDLDKHALLPLKPGDAVLATFAAHALIRRSATLVLYDAEVRAEQQLPGSVDKFPELLLSGSYVFVSPLLVNLATGSVVGSTPARPLGLSSRGLLLVGESGQSAGALAEGPLHWLALGSADALP